VGEEVEREREKESNILMEYKMDINRNSMGWKWPLVKEDT